MLEVLKFVQGSVAKKELLPALTHVRIEGGRVYGYNGSLALSAPIDFEIDCTPKAVPLIKAIDKCTEAVQLGMTPSGRLSVKSGKFKAYIECVEGPTPHVKPAGRMVPVDGEAVVKALKVLYPIVSTDASRPWSNGVLLDGQSAFATNNVILTEVWLGVKIPETINIPRDAVREILRVKGVPKGVQMDDKSLTIHYEDGKWLRTNLLSTEWPDVRKIIDVPNSTFSAIPESFFEELDQAKPFTDKTGKVTFEDGLLRTHAKGSEEGVEIESEYFKGRGCYAVSMLLALNGIATKADFSKYPNPCPWVGNRTRGVIIGLRWLDDGVKE